MQCIDNEKHILTNLAPEYQLIPDALSASKAHALKEFTVHLSPKKQWYGRLTFWTECYHADVDANLVFTMHHVKKHPGNDIMDELTSLFLRTLLNFGVELQNRRIELEVYIDRNEVNKSNAKKSDLFWHRDHITTKIGDAVADYSMVYLLSDENEWKGGDMLLQKGGKALDRERWENSKEPITRIHPRYNQAVVFQNSDSAHKIEAIDPVGDSVQRDVVIITCKLQD